MQKCVSQLFYFEACDDKNNKCKLWKTNKPLKVSAYYNQALMLLMKIELYIL